MVKVSVQLLSPVWLFVTPRPAARQASLSITDSWSLLKLMSIESVMPSNQLILCHPLLFLPSIFPNIRVFSNESALCIRWPKYWSFTSFIGKDSDAGRDWGQEEKGTTEDEMAGWHHWLDGRESEWTPGDGDGQGGLACCNSWGHKELDTTERLNWTQLNGIKKYTTDCQDLGGGGILVKGYKV